MKNESLQSKLLPLINILSIILIVSYFYINPIFIFCILNCYFFLILCLFSGNLQTAIQNSYK